MRRSHVGRVGVLLWNNAYGQIGDGTTGTSRLAPISVSVSMIFRQLSAFGFFIVGIIGP
jgi:hypothetical protein